MRKEEFRPVNILIIDDDPVTRRFLGLQLTMLKAKAQSAGGGQEGLELTRATAFDLILLDCQMPDMDGYQTAAALRQSGYSGPLVGLSAEDGAAIRERCLQAGMDEHRPKPVDITILKELVDKYVEGKQASAEPPPPAPAPAPARNPSSDPLARVRFMAEKSGFPGLAKRLVDSFVKANDEVMEQLAQSVAGQDTATLLSCLHRLKGSAGSFGAEDFGNEATRLEEQMEARGLPPITPDLLQFGDDWKKLREVLLQGVLESG